jgi:hypothetical protein
VGRFRILIRTVEPEFCQDMVLIVNHSRKNTHLLGNPGRLEMALTSLTTGGEECSLWTSGNRYEGHISSKARA